MWLRSRIRFGFGVGAALAGTLVVGCTSYKADVKTICDSAVASQPDRAQIAPAERESYFLEWSDHNIWTPEGKALLTKLRAAKTAGERAALLRESARATGALGAKRCALADYWENQSSK